MDLSMRIVVARTEQGHQFRKIFLIVRQVGRPSIRRKISAA